MAQYAMVIDLNRCMGCHTCSVSCKAEYKVPDKEGRCWVKRLGPAQTPDGIAYTFYPGLCNQCNKPVCVDACPVPLVRVQSTGFQNGQKVAQNVAATWKDYHSGIVLIDTKRCIGCGACLDSCPYGARFINTSSTQGAKAEKCDFCYDRLAAGQQPFCVETCLGHARFFGDLEDPETEVSRYIEKGAIPLISRRVDLKPNVFYFGKKKDIYLLKETSSPMKML